MSSTYSRRESLRDAVVTELEAISVANGYRTDPVKVSRAVLLPSEVGSYPAIYVAFQNPEAIKAIDDGRTVFHSETKLVVVGYYSGDRESAGSAEMVPGETDGEPLYHDIKRCIGAFIKKNINHATNPWHVMFKNFLGYGPYLSREMRSGEVRVECDIQIQAQDGDF